MKKGFILILIALFIPLLTCGAQDIDSEEFSFTLLADGTAEITHYNGSGEEVIIPEQINGYPVNSIGSTAFNHNETIRTLSLPETIISIGDHAFSECTALESVTLPDGLLMLGELAFQGDTVLEQVTLPASLMTIGMNPFDRCEAISEVSFSGENNYYTIVDGVLFNRDGSQLISYPAGKTDEEYIIPEGVTEIDYAAFSENSHIKALAIGDSVEKINGNPFCGCTELALIAVSPLNPYYEVRSNAFLSLRDRELIMYLWGTEEDSYSVPQGIKSIAQEAFYKHTELKSITLPQSLISIKDAAFAESGLESITIPENVISLGNSTFSHCMDLETVKLPSGLTWIGDYAFYECEALNSVSFPKSLYSIGTAAFYHCTALTELELPESLRFIGDYAFLECDGIETVDFPTNLFSIGKAAFWGNTTLTAIVEPGTLGEEWAQQNEIHIEYKNIEYLEADFA